MTETTNVLGTSNAISILEQILQTPALIAYEKKMREFNPFAALRLKDYEIRHTNTLAWLLDAQGSHGLGDKFLENFLKKVRIIASERQTPSEHHSKFFTSGGVKITDEDRFPENHPGRKPPNRLDIWLEGVDWAIALEAKIDSSEGENQLGRYSTEIDNRYKKRNQIKDTIFLFLTLDKSKPESESNPEAYANWNAVSWLGLVAESLVEALVATHGSIPGDDASYEQKFLLSYLDVIYEKSTREFEVAGALSPSALEDKNMRDKYLGKVRDLIHNPQDNKIKQFLIALKDEWEQYKATRAKETKEDTKTKKAEKIGKIEFWEEFCDAVKIRKKCKVVTDFQSTLQFLLDQVDSTAEGRIKAIKQVIENHKDTQANTVFKILHSTTNSITFIPNTWVNKSPRMNDKPALYFFVAYRRPYEDIEWKIEFSSDLKITDWSADVVKYLLEDKVLFPKGNLTNRKTGLPTGPGGKIYAETIKFADFSTIDSISNRLIGDFTTFLDKEYLTDLNNAL